MTTIKDLEERLDSFEKSLLQMQKNLIPQTANLDNTMMKTAELDTKVEKTIDTVIPQWNPSGYEYFAGERIKYNGQHYRCLQAHTSQADWKPDTAVSLWVKVSDPAIEWPEWRQPTGAHDAYARGDKVSHNSKHWISVLDANVWEPGVDGWSEA